MSAARLSLLSVALASLLAGLGGASTASASRAGSRARVQIASTTRVLHAVAAARLIKSVPSNVNPALKDAVNDNGYPQAYAEGCEAPAEKVQMPACVYGDPHGKKTMLLFGDSHAEMWLPGFDALAKRIHWKLVYLAKSGCPPAYIAAWDPYRNRFPFTECDQWHKYATARIRKTKPNLLVLTDEYLTPEGKDKAQIQPPQWTAGLVKTLKLIETPGSRTVILGDIPYLKQSAPECLAAHQNDVQACSASVTDAVLPDHIAAEQTAAKLAHAQYIDTLPWFCSTKTCTPVIADTIVYSDQYHITGSYGIYLSGALQAALRLH